jgi:MoxR-like ATPase
MIVKVDGRSYDFSDIVNLNRFDDPGFTRAIYQCDMDSLWDETATGRVTDDDGKLSSQVTLKLYQWSLLRILRLQLGLSKYFVGYDKNVQVMVACAIAQEPILFIGAPGVAKTELALAFFNGMGLRKPTAGDGDDYAPGQIGKNKYFEYLLSPYTIPEELFGVLNFEDLKKGIVSRINTNMATGQRVLGIFLDEIFNATSSILNTLLSLINERRYFDKGRFQAADLKIFIGATNMTPVSKFGSSQLMSGQVSSELDAFYDRFTIRLYFPTPQEIYEGNPGKIMEMYETISNISSERFMEKLTKEQPTEFQQMASINDFLLLGRLLKKIPFSKDIDQLKNWIVANLAAERSGRRLCHMAPRKPNKLMPIIRADTLLVDIDQKRKQYMKIKKKGNDSEFHKTLSVDALMKIVSEDKEKGQLKVDASNLKIFHHIWDHEADRSELAKEIDLLIQGEI